MDDVVTRTRACRVSRVAALLVVAGLLTGCAASRAFSRAEEAAQQDNWEEAVEYYRVAARDRPDRPEYRIALERAQQEASIWHLARARELEEADRLEEALREYRKAADFDPSNRQTAFRASEVERVIRERIEAARPRPAIDLMREQARRAAQEPVLNPASRDPLSLRFTDASLKDILTFIGNSTGINVTYDRDFQDRSITIQLDGVTLEQALEQLMIANQFFYKVLSERSIIVAADTTQKRQQYEEQVIRTFYVSHSDATELAQLVNTVIRVPAMAIQPMIAANKTSNTITVRASTSVAGIIERMIEANDKPRAEIVVDVSILEVSRERTKNLGLDLSSYAISGFFSPETAPATGTDATPPFNVNTISRGVSTADFYMAVPSAIVRFLESDSETKVVAKPQLRGSEGQKVTLNLGEEVPVPSTTFTPFAGGGANVNPLTSFSYRPIGVIVEMTPRVTYDGEIIMDLVVESSARGRDSNIAGQNLPSFGSRKVSTRLRLRDGESNLLAGLLREDERRALRGFAGVLRMPILRELFSSTDATIQQTDIVMLLTPRIIRTHELTQNDLSPIYIGTQGNMSLGGPPPIFGVQDPPPAEAQAPPTGVAPQVPPGSSAIPGTTMAPVPPAATPPSAVTAFPPPPETPVETPAPVDPPDAAPIGQTAAQIMVTPPGAELTVGGGPYTVPVSVVGASRLSTVTVSLTFNPAVLRVRSVQEGTFMRQGGVNAAFSQQVDAASGRIDLVVTRTGDATGAVGAGLLAAILFDAVAPGSSPLSASGAATAPDGAGMPLQFSPVTVTVR